MAIAAYSIVAPPLCGPHCVYEARKPGTPSPASCNPRRVGRRLSYVGGTARPVRLPCKALHEESSPGTDFNLAEYTEAIVISVHQDNANGHQIVLKLLDANEKAATGLAIFVGDAESKALQEELFKKMQMQNKRPGTYDLMRNSLHAFGARVTKACVTALVGSIYHAQVYYSYEGRSEVWMDARPSDAINLAVRFRAPIYVNKGVAVRMAAPLRTIEAKPENESQVESSCREAIQNLPDPTFLLKVQQQVAITEERYDDAARIRDQIWKMLSGNRALSLSVAIEAALQDKRYAEAAALRDEFKRLIAQTPASY